MKVTKNFYNKGYKIHIDDHDELWWLHSNCSQSSEFLGKAEKRLRAYKAADCENVRAVFRELGASQSWFPGWEKLDSLAEMTKQVLGTDAAEAKENIKAGFWFVLTCAPWLVGALTLLATLAHWLGVV